MVNNYKPIIYTDVDEDLYVLKQYGKSMKRSPTWKPRPRSDLILWDESSSLPELNRDLDIDVNMDPTLKQSILTIIKDNWDSFCEKGASRPMLDFEFCIDTGDSKPVCCRQPSYGIHERKIMDEHIQALEANDWICDCEGPWGSIVVLAPKPHQESCVNIKDFVWRLCISYRPLNGVTKSFEFPIPRCTDSIENFGDSSGRMYFISLDARSGYHQIRVRKRDQEKLVFFTPNGKKENIQGDAFWTQKCTCILYCDDAVLT